MLRVGAHLTIKSESSYQTHMSIQHALTPNLCNTEDWSVAVSFKL